MILFNWISLYIIKIDVLHFKGSIAIGGIGKEVVSYGFIGLILYAYIDNSYLDVYKEYLPQEDILYRYLRSPLFITWLIMNLYLNFISYLKQFYDNNIVYMFLYIILCMVLVLFQYNLLRNFQMKNKFISCTRARYTGISA